MNREQKRGSIITLYKNILHRTPRQQELKYLLYSKKPCMKYNYIYEKIKNSLVKFITSTILIRL
jgi:hypothetical protein